MAGPESGPTIIEVQGAVGHRALIDDALDFADLTGIRSVTYDRRGRGESGGSGTSDSYEIEREIEDLAAIISDARDRVVVVGQSTGAILALEAAVTGIEMDALVLYEPPLITDGSRTPISAAFVNRLEELIADGDAITAFRIFMNQALGMPDATIAGVLDGWKRALIESVASNVVHDAIIMHHGIEAQSERPGRFESLRVPTLVLVGTDTFPHLPAAAAVAAATIPGATLERLEGAGHLMRSETVAAHLKRFVATTLS